MYEAQVAIEARLCSAQSLICWDRWAILWDKWRSLRGIFIRISLVDLLFPTVEVDITCYGSKLRAKGYCANVYFRNCAVISAAILYLNLLYLVGPLGMPCAGLGPPLLWGRGVLRDPTEVYERWSIQIWVLAGGVGECGIWKILHQLCA